MITMRNDLIDSALEVAKSSMMLPKPWTRIEESLLKAIVALAATLEKLR